MQWWEQPAFYIAVVSLMANIGNYLKSKTTTNTGKAVIAEWHKAKQHLIRTGTVPPEVMK